MRLLQHWVLQTLFALGLCRCGNLVQAAERIAKVDFEGNTDDLYGYVVFYENPYKPASNIVTYVPGHTGLAARWSSNNDDSGDALVGYFVGNNPLPASNEIYISYWLKFEADYYEDDQHWNVKQLRFDGANGGHLGISITGAHSGRICFIVQGAPPSYVHPGDISDWPCSAAGSYTLGDWAHFAFYLKLSTGPDHFNPDGIVRIWINGAMIYETTDAVTGDYVGGDVDGCPSIQAEGDPLPGHGWRQIDDYEIWDGMPDSGLDAGPSTDVGTVADGGPDRSISSPPKGGVTDVAGASDGSQVDRSGGPAPGRDAEGSAGDAAETRASSNDGCGCSAVSGPPLATNALWVLLLGFCRRWRGLLPR